MHITVMQPYFLPYIGYFQLINAVDKFVLLDDVNYINRGWINRNRIAINQQPHWLTIPLEKASQNRLINEISLHRDSLWREKLCLTVKTNYSKAPFFEIVYPIFDNILNFPSVDLSAFLHHSLKEILSYLKITTFIVPTSVVYPKNDLKGQYRILDICQREGATIYLNPPGGKELYERELFRAAGIDLYFLEPDLQGMNLVSGVNQSPVLSILDLMMLNHPDMIRQTLECYQLV
jgi:hypothetical protein